MARADERHALTDDGRENPSRWLSDRRLQRLSDAHFRAFVTALVWAVANRTDGVIEREDLALIPNFAPCAVKALVDAGLWTPLAQGWCISDFGATQTSREQLAAAEVARVRERDKKARQRAAKRATTSTTCVVPGDVPGDVPWDNAGQDRTGQDKTGHEVGAVATGAASDNSKFASTRVSRPTSPQWRGAEPSPFDEYK